MLGLALGLGLQSRRAAWSPSSLFPPGRQGIWLDPSNRTTLFQNAAGTTPVLADGDPVGLILDKSGRGNHARQSVPSKCQTWRTDGTRCWLQSDGADDFMVTGPVGFSGTDKITVIAGLHKESTPTQMVVAEFATTNVVGDSGSFILNATNDGIPYRWLSLARGNAVLSYNQGAYVAVSITDTAVFSSTHDISGSRTRLWCNGTEAAPGTGTKGAGNFGNHPLYIGMRAGEFQPFSGRIYGLIIIGALLSDADRQQAERWMAQRMGVSW